MHFPKNMTFQYFFFDTYIGYFLQALPIALLVGIIYYFIKFKNDKKTKTSKKILSCMFVSYIVGLVCLTIGLDTMNIIWYKLIYNMDPGTKINWYKGDFNLSISFINNLTKENIMNIIMLIPFGILYPLSQKETNFKDIIIKGFILVLTIELLEPIFGRAFDINDIILNTIGVLLSSIIYIVIKEIIKGDKNNERNNKKFNRKKKH